MRRLGLIAALVAVGALAGSDTDPWTKVQSQQEFTKPTKFDREVYFSSIDAGSQGIGSATIGILAVTSDAGIATNLTVGGQITAGAIDAGYAAIAQCTISGAQLTCPVLDAGYASIVLVQAGAVSITATNQPANGHDLAAANTPRVTANSIEVARWPSTGQVSSVGNGTAGSGTGITTAAASTGFFGHRVHKVTVINTALTAAGTTDLTIWTTPVNTRLLRIVADVTQVFTGGSLSAMTLTCGNAAGGNQYLLSNSVFTAQNTWGDGAAEIGAGLVSATVADMGTSAAGVPGAITISCRFTCTGANCSAATQGSVTFDIEHVVYP